MDYKVLVAVAERAEQASAVVIGARPRGGCDDAARGSGVLALHLPSLPFIELLAGLRVAASPRAGSVRSGAALGQPTTIASKTTKAPELAPRCLRLSSRYE